jgi:hypothetical protein
MFKMALKYVHSVFILHVSATQGHLQATSFKGVHCTVYLVKYYSLRHVVIINFDVVGCFSSYLLCCDRFCVPFGVPLSWLCVSSVALCSLYYRRKT